MNEKETTSKLDMQSSASASFNLDSFKDKICATLDPDQKFINLVITNESGSLSQIPTKIQIIPADNSNLDMQSQGGVSKIDLRRESLIFGEDSPDLPTEDFSRSRNKIKITPLSRGFTDESMSLLGLNQNVNPLPTSFSNLSSFLRTPQ